MLEIGKLPVECPWTPQEEPLTNQASKDVIGECHLAYRSESNLNAAEQIGFDEKHENGYHPDS